MGKDAKIPGHRGILREAAGGIFSGPKIRGTTSWNRAAPSMR